MNLWSFDLCLWLLWRIFFTSEGLFCCKCDLFFFFFFLIDWKVVGGVKMVFGSWEAWQEFFYFFFLCDFLLTIHDHQDSVF